MDSNNRPKPHPPIKKVPAPAPIPLEKELAENPVISEPTVEVTQLGTGKKARVPAKEVQKTPSETPTIDKRLRENQVKKDTTPIPAGEFVPAPTEKKPYVLKEHLTERPFKHHEGLQQLMEAISEPSARYSGKHRSSSSKGRK